MAEHIEVGWTMDIWDGDGRGFRFSRDAEFGRQCDEPVEPDETSEIEFGLLMTREQAEDRGLLEHVTHGDSSAYVNVAKLNPECTVYLFGGMANAQQVAAWLRRVLVLIEGVPRG